MNQWAVVDLETTGGSPGGDRVTEIGVVLLDDVVEVGRFQSLVDPGRPIPPFVQNLTGITDQMVRGAPSFHQLADELWLMLQDRILVAHNVAFDYRFLRHEFALCGKVFDPGRLCTVQLGRKLYPGHASYSLGNFASSLGLGEFRHHRAMNDTLACAGILCKALNEHGEDKVCRELKGRAVPGILPVGWTTEMIRAIPDMPGILWVHGLKGDVLHVTECRSLRTKALHLLSMGRRSPLWVARQGIGDISFELTGSELLAKIRVLQEISEKCPPCNRPVRLPVYSGAPLGSLALVGPGRDSAELCLLAVRSGRVLGYRFIGVDESISFEERWEHLELFGKSFDPAVLIRQQIQRGGGGWRVVDWS